MRHIAVLLACIARLGQASFDQESREAPVLDDVSLLQNANPRQRLAKCAKTYFSKLQKMQVDLSKSRPWSLPQSLSATKRDLVIGAGPGTTGTRSVCKVLERMGLHGYHWNDEFATANEHVRKHKLPDLSQEIYGHLLAGNKGGGAHACYKATEKFDFSKLPAHVDYVSDTPFPEMFLDVFAQFPHAKVVLTTRPSLEWAERRRAEHKRTLPPVIRPCGLGMVHNYKPDKLARMLEAYNELVRCAVPKEQLLEINVFDHGNNWEKRVKNFIHR